MNFPPKTANRKVDTSQTTAILNLCWKSIPIWIRRRISLQIEAPLIYSKELSIQTWHPNWCTTIPPFHLRFWTKRRYPILPNWNREHSALQIRKSISMTYLLVTYGEARNCLSQEVTNCNGKAGLPTELRVELPTVILPWIWMIRDQWTWKLKESRLNIMNKYGLL